MHRLYLHSNRWIWPGGPWRLEKLHLIQITHQLPSEQEVLVFFAGEAMATSLCCPVTERTDDTRGSAKAPLAALPGQSAIPSLPILDTQGSCGAIASLALFSFSDTLNHQPFAHYDTFSRGGRDSKYFSWSLSNISFWGDTGNGLKLPETITKAEAGSSSLQNKGSKILKDCDNFLSFFLN